MFSRPRPSLAPLDLEHSLESSPSSTLQGYFSLLCWRSVFFFFCLCNPTWLARDLKLQPIKITQFFGTSTGYGKVKKKQGNFWLPRKRKECATEFKTLADYVIPRKNNTTWKVLRTVLYLLTCRFCHDQKWCLSARSMKTITICSFYNPVFVLELQDSQWYSLVQYFLVLSICKLQTPFLRTCLISFVFGAKKVVIYSVYLWVLGWQISARKFLNH